MNSFNLHSPRGRPVFAEAQDRLEKLEPGWTQSCQIKRQLTINRSRANETHLGGEALHLHGARSHLTVFFCQQLSDQRLHVEEENVAVGVLRVGTEPVDDQRKGAALLQDLQRVKKIIYDHSVLR